MKLIANCLKNFIKCLRFYWIPLLSLLIAAVLGFFVSISTINTLSENVAIELNTKYGTNIEEGDYKWYLIGSFFEGDFKINELELSTVLDKETVEDYVNNNIIEFAKKNNLTEADALVAINDIESSFVSLVSIFSIILIFIFAGYLAGYFITRSVIRKKLAKIKWWQGIIVAIINTILNSFVLAGIASMLTGFNMMGIIITVVSMLITNVVLLIEAYYLHRDSKTRFKEILTLGNCLLLYLASIIITAITTVVTSVVSLIPIFPLITAVGLIPLTIIALAVINLNAESYVIMKKREKH